MSYSVNWATRIVSIPKADTTLVSSSPDVRSLDVLTLWQNLRDLQDDADGMAYVDMVRNTPPVTVAGVTLTRVVELVNNFRIQFEDGQYAVNIIGGNSNIADAVVKNMVSVNTANSAGLVELTPTDFDDLMDNQIVEGGLSVREAMRVILAVLAGKVSGAGTTAITFRDTSDTKNRVAATVDANGNRTAITLDPT
jgi:hypothetical protein